MKLALVGECWGATEARLKRPFAGKAGQVLDRILERVSINRAELDKQGLIFNVFNERPPKNDFGIFYKDPERKEPTDKLCKAWDRVRKDVSSANVNCILCLGKEALRAFVGYKSMEKYRGSIFDHPCGKVIGTYHPSVVNRTGRTEKGIPVEPLIMLDMQKAKREAEFPEYILKDRKRIIIKDFGRAVEWLIHVLEKAGRGAVDIETEPDKKNPENGIVSCIGFAVSDTHSVCIPFFDETKSFFSSAHYWQLIDLIGRVLTLPGFEIIGQNFYYDNYWMLRKWGFDMQKLIKNIWFDNLVAMRVLYPDLPPSLAFQVSFLTNMMYYKDDGKHGKKRNHAEYLQLWDYNCNDVLGTYEGAYKLAPRVGVKW